MDDTDPFTANAAYWDLMALPELSFQATAQHLQGEAPLLSEADGRSFTFFPLAAEGADFMPLDDISAWAAEPCSFQSQGFPILA